LRPGATLSTRGNRLPRPHPRQLLLFELLPQPQLLPGLLPWVRMTRLRQRRRARHQARAVRED
jgi:hypothetical protein